MEDLWRGTDLVEGRISKKQEGGAIMNVLDHEEATVVEEPGTILREWAANDGLGGLSSY